MKRVWNHQKDNLLRRHYPSGDLNELAARVGVSRGAIKARASVLGIHRKVNARHPWTEKQLQYLIAHYADTSMEELEKRTRHCSFSIYNKAAALGLSKSREFIAALGRKTAQQPNSIANRFKKGDVPHNKGKREHEFRSKEACERCRRTQFKSGCKPHNAKPVGYERICKEDGYVYIKVAEDKKMVLKHRYVWEQTNGPIPEGYNVSFRDGNRANCDLSNLFLISRVNSARKQVHSETPEQRKARCAKASETRNRAIRRDKIRIHFGLEPYGKLVKRWRNL